MAKKPVTYDHLKSKKKTGTRSVWIALDPDLAEEHNELEKKLSVLKIRAKARTADETLQQEVAETQAKFDELTALVRESSTKFTFRALGRRRYDELINDHQPTEEQLAEVRKDDPKATIEFNPDTFPVALVAKSLVEPELTFEEVKSIFDDDDWSGAEIWALFQTALNANSTRSTVNLGNV